MKLTWLIGKSSNVDLLWSSYNYPNITNLQTLRTTSLFEEQEENYKYIYNKKDNAQLQTKSETVIIIKGIQKFDKTIINKDKDTIIEVDTLTKPQLFSIFLKNHQITITQEEALIIKNLATLEDLSTIITLKNLNIEIKYWNNFIKTNQTNWYQALKNNTLLELGVKNQQQIIPVLIYAINANHKNKAPLTFLNAKIKQGAQIWQLNQIWKSLFNH